MSWRLMLNFLFCFIGIILLVQPPFLRKLVGESEIIDEKQN